MEPDVLLDPDTADEDHIGPHTLRRVVAAWPRRATVRTDMDKVVEGGEFDALLPDYPERALPFLEHPLYRAASEDQRRLVNTLGWLAYNERVISGEEHVANPTFAMLARGVFPGAEGREVREAVQQAHVDEAWHTYMHMIAVNRTRALRRVDAEPDHIQPIANRSLFTHQAETSQTWERQLLSLVWTAVGEISINGLLALLSRDDTIQPMHAYIAKLHDRDESAHGPVMYEVMRDVYGALNREQRDLVVESLPAAIVSFAAEDYEMWEQILTFAGIPRAREIVADCRSLPGSDLLFTGFGAVERLLGELDIKDRVRFDFTTNQPL